MPIKTPFYAGTSNLVLPIKRTEYPTQFTGASRLTYYASLFSSVEVNATFYKLPRPATVENWGNSVHENFRFTFKVPKCVTHAKDLQFSFEELEVFVDAVNRVGDKKGCLLVQLPPKVSREKEEELSGILESLKENATGWKIAVEFRHSSWYDSGVYRMLQHYDAGMVEHDMPKCPAPKTEVAESFSYIRFHGPEGGYRGSYEEAVLQVHAKRIVEKVKAGKTVFVYFNNTMGDALGNLQTLNGMVGRLLS